jgi:hypothetical protein
MELGVVESAIHGVAAITGRLWIKPEPLTERRRHVNMLEICIGFGRQWKANLHGSKAPSGGLRKSITLFFFFFFFESNL